MLGLLELHLTHTVCLDLFSHFGDLLALDPFDFELELFPLALLFLSSLFFGLLKQLFLLPFKLYDTLFKMFLSLCIHSSYLRHLLFMKLFDE